MIHTKKWGKFNEEAKANEFDDKWEDTENTIDNIVQMTDQYGEQELQMMDYDELHRISDAEEMKRDVDQYQREDVKNILEFKEEDLDPTDSFEVNDALNPDVWDDFDIKVDIRERLLEIANEFINNLYGDFDVNDIMLTGSLASYNWSQYSDFDVHIQIDYSDINNDIGLVENYLDLFGKRWNRDYNITLYDYEVEIYIEDKNDDRTHVNGLYSILKDKWIKRPSDDIQEVDTHLVEKKSINLMEQIDEIESRLDSTDHDELKDDVDRIWDKIKKARRDGINSPDGEYSIGNLVFKYLRRNEYITKIIDIKKQLVENKYSI